VFIAQENTTSQKTTDQCIGSQQQTKYGTKNIFNKRTRNKSCSEFCVEESLLEIWSTFYTKFTGMQSRLPCFLLSFLQRCRLVGTTVKVSAHFHIEHVELSATLEQLQGSWVSSCLN
jgi:hypothetical protein